MEKQILFNQSTPNELIETILTGVKTLIDESSKPQPTNSLLTREQVCNILNIDKSTLWHWTKKGKLQSYGIGARVYYKSDEVLSSVKPLRV